MEEELQAKDLTFHINKTLGFQTQMSCKLTVYDIMPLLKDKRTASNLRYFMNFHPKGKAQQIKTKIQILHSNQQYFSKLKLLAVKRAALQEQKRKLRLKLQQAIRNRVASANLVDTRRRERNQINYSTREYKTTCLQLKNDIQNSKQKKQILFNLIVKFQKDITHVSILPSFEEYRKIAQATHFLCDVLATSKQGQVPTSIPAIEMPQDFHKFNKNQLLVRFNTTIIKCVQDIVSFQAQSAQVMAMASIEKKKKYLEQLNQIMRYRREHNKTQFLQNQKNLALVNKKYETIKLSEEKKEEIQKLNEQVTQDEQLIYSTQSQKEMLERLQCIQSLFSLFLKHKKRVDSFVQKKVVPIGEPLKNYSRGGSLSADFQIKLIHDIFEMRTQIPRVQLTSDLRFQVADQRGSQILQNLGWRNYQTLQIIFEGIL